MKRTMIINPLNSDNSNIANNKTQHCQTMTTITVRILKFETMIKKLTVGNYTFFTVVTFGRINSSVKSILS